MLSKFVLANIAAVIFCIHILFLYDYLGVVGGTLFPTFFIMLCMVYVMVKKEKFILLGLKKLRILVIISFIIALFSTLIYSVGYQLDDTLVDLFKAITVIFIFYSPLIIYQDIGNVGKNFVRLAFILNIIIFVICFLLPDQIYSSPFISDQYGTSVVDKRPRGLTQEASHFSALLLLLFVCYSAVTKNRQEAMFFLAITLVVIYFSGSKFAYITICAYCVLDSRLSYFYKLILILIFSFTFLMLAFDAISVDIERFNSTSTRVNALTDGLRLMLINPFGLGILNWEFHFAGISNDTYRFIPINVEYEQMVKTGQNLSTKSVWLDSFLYLGWLFGIITIVLVRQIWRNSYLNNRMASIITIFLVGAATSGIFTFFIMLALGFLACYGSSHENTSSRKI